MDCLILPVSILRRRNTVSRLGYQPLTLIDHEEGFGGPVTVIVGKDKREFLVDPFVLEKNPFRILIDSVVVKKNSHFNQMMRKKRVIFVDVDAILFEHMLWLMHNDSSSLFQLNIREIIDFYAQDC